MARTPNAKKLGDDNGCFESALRSVRKFGGVLEHPEASKAYDYFGLRKPNRNGQWQEADSYGWSIFVEQGHYGHRARKGTWLYAVVPDPLKLPLMPRGKSDAKVRLDGGYHSSSERYDNPNSIERMNHWERAATPVRFAQTLIALAELSLK